MQRFFLGRGGSQHWVVLLDLARLVLPYWVWTGLWTGLQNLDLFFFWKIWNLIASSLVNVPVDFLLSSKEVTGQPCFWSVLENTLLHKVHLCPNLEWTDVICLSQWLGSENSVTNGAIVFLDLKFNKVNFMSKT